MPGNFSMFASDSELQHTIWLGAGGSMLVLLQSILSDEKRVWWKLILSCIIGGAAAVLAGEIFNDSRYVYAICGVAAVTANNILFGLVNASAEFRDNPIKVFSHFWRLVMPSFGKGTDKPAEDVGDGERDLHRDSSHRHRDEAAVG